MTYISRFWPWALLLFSAGILGSSVFLACWDPLHPWTDGENELSQTAGAGWTICVGYLEEEKRIVGTTFEDSDSTAGYTTTIPKQLVHRDEQHREYQQRSYIFPSALLSNPGIWTVSKNQDGEYSIDFSRAAFIQGILVYLLLVVLLFVALGVIKSRMK